MKPVIFVTLPLRPKAMVRLEDYFELVKLWESSDPDALLNKAGSTIRGVATTGETGLSASQIDRLPNLEIVSCFGVGVDSIDAGACAARSIPITNTPDVLSKDVADLAIGLILSVCRRMVEGDDYVRSGKWQDGPMRLGRSLQGMRLGVLGLGRIGLELCRRAEIFEMDIAYHNRRAKPDLSYRYFAELEGLATDVDILALTCPGGEATHHLVNKDVLTALGPDGILINVARGSVVDEQALINALESGAIAAAGLDVFENEPHVPDALLAMPNVVLQPHQASATDDTRDAMANLVVDNLIAHFEGKPLLTRFN